MGTEGLEMSRVTNGEAENSLHKQVDQVPAEGFIIGRCENLLSDGNDGVANPGEVSHSHSLEAKIQPDTAVCSLKRARQQKELTFQDMYQNQEMFDEDDDDDSDWEPLQLPKCVEVIKWFCTNCTMVNLDDVVHCDICGEHKDSKILSYGFFASPFAENEDPTEVQPKVKEGLRVVGSRASATSTAIGFDERMLLHAEYNPTHEAVLQIASVSAEGKPTQNMSETRGRNKGRRICATNILLPVDIFACLMIFWIHRYMKLSPFHTFTN